MSWRCISLLPEGRLEGWDVMQKDVSISSAHAGGESAVGCWE